MVAAGRTLSIQARPMPVTVDLSRTAVIVVDMQNDFGSPGGMFDRAGIDIGAIKNAIAPTASGAGRGKGVPGVKGHLFEDGIPPGSGGSG